MIKKHLMQHFSSLGILEQQPVLWTHHFNITEQLHFEAEIQENDLFLNVNS